MNKNENETSNSNVAETTQSTDAKSDVKTPAKKATAKKVAKKATAKPAVKKVKPTAKKPTVKKPAAKPAAKKAPVKKVVKTPAKKSGKAEVRHADNSNRNFGRIKVGAETLSKGRAVHAVVVAFVDKKKPTLAQLQTAFSPDLLKNYGIIQEIGKAKKYSINGKNRFFVGKEDLITTKDGKTVAVCNQFSTDNVKPFIKHAKTLGFTMTPVAGK